MRSLRQSRLFGGGAEKGKDLNSNASKSKVRALLQSLWGGGGSSGQAASFSRPLAAGVLTIGVLLVVLIVLDIREADSRLAHDDPLVLGSSYLSDEQLAKMQRRGVADAAANVGDKVKAPVKAARDADSIRGLVINSGDAGAQPTRGVLEYVYHLLGGPLRHTGSGKVGGAVRSGGNGRVRGRSSSGEFSNMPNAYLSPWQYGLRAPQGFGGGDDWELSKATPQGEPQPLEPESLQDAAGEGLGDAARKYMDEQLSDVKKRYYDADEMLLAYQSVMSNQQRFADETQGSAKPIQVVRAREDELPMPYRW